MINNSIQEQTSKHLEMEITIMRELESTPDCIM